MFLTIRTKQGKCRYGVFSEREGEHFIADNWNTGESHWGSSKNPVGTVVPIASVLPLTSLSQFCPSKGTIILIQELHEFTQIPTTVLHRTTFHDSHLDTLTALIRDFSVLDKLYVNLTLQFNAERIFCRQRFSAKKMINICNGHFAGSNSDEVHILLQDKIHVHITCHQSSEECAVLLLTNTLTGTCLARFIPRCLNWYLLFWNQFLICSSVMSKAPASSARSSRVKYCWRENTSSKYLSCICVKWLRLRFFFAVLFAAPVVSLTRLASSIFLFALAELLSNKMGKEGKIFATVEKKDK